MTARKTAVKIRSTKGAHDCRMGVAGEVEVRFVFLGALLIGVSEGAEGDEGGEGGDIEKSPLRDRFRRAFK